MPAVLELIERGSIKPGLVATEVLPFDDAADALPAAGYRPVLAREPLNGRATTGS